MKNNNVYHVKYANMENQRDFDSSQHVPRMLMSPPQFPSPSQMATVSSSAQQPVNVQQPINFQQISRIVRLTTPQHTTNLRLSKVRKCRSGQQSTNVQLARIPQLVNIQQPASVQQPMNVQQPVSVQQSASVQPVIVQQSVNVQQPADIPQSANIQQRASAQQPVSVQRSASVQQPVIVQQSASVQQPVNVQPMSIQQPVSVQQSASVQQPVIDQQSMHVQRLKSVLRTPSVNNSASNQIVVGNVMIPLNQAQLQRLKNNNKLKQDGTGSLEMHVQNDKRIKFVYKPNGNEILGITNFKFKVTLLYRNFTRKWYISPGYSFVPEVIDLRGRLRSGTRNPVSDEVMNIIYDVRSSIHAYIIRLTVAHEFIRDARRKYRDMQFYLHPTLRMMELRFREDAWPGNLRKLDRRDVMVVKMTLDKKLRIRNVAYKYAYEYSVVKKVRNEHFSKLRTMLKNFLNYPLKEAFDKFMRENCCSE